MYAYESYGFDDPNVLCYNQEITEADFSLTWRVYQHVGSFSDPTTFEPGHHFCYGDEFLASSINPGGPAHYFTFSAELNGDGDWQVISETSGSHGSYTFPFTASNIMTLFDLNDPANMFGSYRFKAEANTCYKHEDHAEEYIWGSFPLFEAPPTITDIHVKDLLCPDEDTEITLHYQDVISGSNFIYSIAFMDFSPGECDFEYEGENYCLTPLTTESTSLSEGVNVMDVLTLSHPPGLYLFTVEIGSGCPSDPFVFEIKAPPSFSASIVSVSPPSCFGNNDGQVVVEIEGGLPPYTYEGEEVDAIFTVSGLASGHFSGPVSDQCDEVLLNTSIGDGPVFITSAENIVDPTCGSNGSLEITTHFEGENVEFELTNGITTWGAQPTPAFTNLPSGTYTALAIIDGLCEFTEMVILEPVPDITLDIDKANAICTNGSGAIIFQSSEPDIHVNYTVAGNTVMSGSISTQEFVDHIFRLELNPGTYNLHVANNCNDQIIYDDEIIIQNIDQVDILSISDVEIQCFDGSDGILSFHIANGTPPYFPVLEGYPVEDEGNGDYRVEGLSLGAYTMSVTDDCGVVDTEGFSVITANNATEITLDNFSVFSDISCFGFNDGEIEVDVAGGYQVPSGDKGYIVKLIDEEETEITGYVNEGDRDFFKFQNLEPGNYYPAVEDGNGCLKTFPLHTLNISEPSPLFISDVIPSHFAPNQVQYDQGNNLYIQCHGNLVDFSPEFGGGTVEYSFTLEGGTISGQITDEGPYENLGPGTYDFTMTDDNGCSESISFELAEPAEFTLSLSPAIFSHGFNVECYGDDTGEVTADVSGGISPYEFSIDPPELLPILLEANAYTFSNLPVGESPANYTVTVTDYLGCEVQKTITLEPPPPLTFISEIISETVGEFEIPCKGEAATIRFTGNGGDHTNPYTLLIDGDPTGLFNVADKTIEVDLEAGSYNIKIRDELGCESQEASLNLTEPDEVVSISNIDEIYPNCIGGSDGSFTITPSGGITPFEYKLEDGPWQTSSTFSGLEATSYDITVRDFNQCDVTHQVTIPSNPNPLTLELVERIPPSCHHGTDGSITVRATHFDLKSGDQLLYRITGGHYGEDIIEVNAIVNPGASEHFFTFENLWDTKDPDFVVSHYEIWVEDLHECEDIINQYVGGSELELKAPDPLELTTEIVPPSCYGGENGWFTVRANGGTGEYLFSLNDTNYSPSNTTDPSLFIVKNQKAGDYTVYLRDSNFQPEQPTCQTFINIHVPEGFDMEFSPIIDNISCAGGSNGSITVNLDTYFSDETPYSYEPNQLSLIWMFGQEIIGNGHELFDIPKGNYSLSAQYNQDTIVCVEQMDFPVLGPTTPFNISNIKTYKSPCGDLSNGRAIVEYQGGWADSIVYYNLDDSDWFPILGSSLSLNHLSVGEHEIQLAQSEFKCIAGQTLMIEEAAIQVNTLLVLPPSCSSGGNNGQVILSAMNIEDPVFQIADSSYSSSTGSYSGLKTGHEYKLVVTDGANTLCSSDTIAFLFPECFDDTDDLQIAGIPVLQQSTCEVSEDAVLEVVVIGGLPPYQYFLNGTEVSSSTVSGLSSGFYQVVVFDELGKRDTAEIEVGVLSEIELSGLVSTKATCQGFCDGAITNMAFAGGSGFYNVEWEDGVIGPMRSGLCAGEYSYMVYDERNNLCALTGTVVIDQFEELSIGLEKVTSPTCHNGTDGKINIAAVGGSYSFSFEWENGQSSSQLINVNAGNHSVTVTDKILGCSLTKLFTLPDKPHIVVTDTLITPPSCQGASDGSIRVTIGNGNSPFVQWENGQTGLTATNLSAGIHGFTVSTSKGCEIQGEIELKERAPLTVEVSSTDNTCSGYCSGTISLSVSGGLGPYYVEWESGIKSFNRTALCNGTYSYMVRDRLGCKKSGSLKISSPEPLVIHPTGLKNVNCFGEANGSIAIEVAGGTAPYTYAWSNGEDQYDISGLPKGNYGIWVTDANGCTIHGSFTITQPGTLFTSGDQIMDPSCAGYNDGQIKAFPVGGTGPYTYKWNNNVTTSANDQLPEGAFEVLITDATGCEYTRSYELSDPPALDLANIQITDPGCHDEASGSVSLIAIGGSQAYTYAWSDGHQSPAKDQLPAGEYEVVVTDDQGCTLSQQFELINPEIPIIRGLNNHIMMCGGGSVMLAPEGEWKTYLWQGPGGLASQEGSLEVSEGGDYSLTVTDDLDCQASQDIYVEVSDNILKADFIRISEAVVNEPLVFVDLTLPVPESVKWVIPELSSILINNMDESSVELVFTATGDYAIGLQASFQTCYSEIFKTVRIEEGESPASNTRIAESAKKTEVSIYPNPTRDQLHLLVNVSSREKVILRLMDVSKDILIEETLEGRMDYLVKWNVTPMTSGVYILMIESGDDFQKKRVMIVK